MDEEQISDSGLFWWSDSEFDNSEILPKEYSPGKLTIGADGKILLEINGNLEDTRFSLASIDELEESAMIVGVLRNSGEYVLLFGLERGMQTFRSYGGISFEDYFAAGCLKGSESFGALEEPPKIKDISIDCEPLDKWMQSRNIKTKVTQRSVNLYYKKQKKIEQRFDGLTVSISKQLIGSAYRSRTSRSEKITEETRIIFNQKRKLKIGEAPAECRRIENFFSTLTGKILSFPKIQITLEKKSKTYDLYLRKTEKKLEKIEWHQNSIKYCEIEEEIAKLYSIWRKKSGVYGSGFYLFYGTTNAKSLYLENRYVNLIWGLESFHRSGNRVFNNKKIEEKIDRILEATKEIALNHSDRRWLKKSLNKESEPNLEKRLVDLFSELPVTFHREKLEEFCRKCAKRRNEISHFGGVRSEKGEEYEEMIRDLTIKYEVLVHLYRAIILNEITVNNDAIKNYLEGDIRRGDLEHLLAVSNLSIIKT
ncbi:MAG: HEPN domain-containing protein [Pseudomonas sp.]